VSAFQISHSLPATGTIGNLTWHALLRIPPVAVHWSAAGARVAGAAGAPRGVRALIAPPPRSARLPARGQEFSFSPGRG
jgi:hypothetical protein